MSENLTGKDVVILGAGPAGLAAALLLNKAKKNIAVADRNAAAGGLCRTFEADGYYTDIGPHRFFGKYPFIFRVLQNYNTGSLTKVKRLTRSYVKEKFFNTSGPLTGLISGAGVWGAVSILSGYAAKRLKDIILRRKPASFKEMAVSYFGNSQISASLVSYAEKMWGIDASFIMPQWSHTASRHLPKAHDESRAEDYFYCHEKGCGYVYNEIKNVLSKNAENAVCLNSEIVKVCHENSIISQIYIDRGDGKTVLKAGNYISTIPLNRLALLLDPLPSIDIIEAAKTLRFRSHISVFLTIDKNRVMKDQWIYFPGKDIPFLRVSEPKNFSPQMSPKGKTSLLIEYFCFDGDDVWNMARKDFFALTVKHLTAAGLIIQSEVTAMHLFKEKDAYPLAEAGSEKALQTLNSYFAGFNNLELAGRGGLFLYGKQDDAINSGIAAAENILRKNGK